MVKKYELKCYEGDHPRINVTKGFISKNKLTLNRTPEEIIKRMKGSGMFDFATDVLMDYLKFDDVKGFLKKEYIDKVEKGKEKWKVITNVSETAQDFLDYMVFGWMKAMDQRGISAGRTINKLGHWLWLMGRDDLKAIINDEDLYNPYGSPALIAICKKLGIKVPKDLIEFSKKKVN